MADDRNTDDPAADVRPSSPRDPRPPSPATTGTGASWIARAWRALTGRGRHGRTRLGLEPQLPPHLQGIDLTRLARNVAIALAPCSLVVLGAALLEDDAPWSATARLLATFAVALLSGVFWVRVFAGAREREVSVGTVATALLFTLALPSGVPLWQVALGAGFGVVIGQEVFGGSGRGFVHPVVAALVFLQFAYPERMAGATTLGALDATSSTASAVLLGAGWLLAHRAARWRVIVAGALGFLAADLAFGRGVAEWPDAPLLGAYAFGLVFLAADPVTAGMTSVGCWFQGLLIGALTVLLDVANPELGQAVPVAILFGSVCTPSVDLAVKHRRARRAEVRVG